MFTDDGGTLVTADVGAENVVVEHWDMATGSGPRQVLVADTATDVDDLRLSPDGRTLAISTDTETGAVVQLWDIADRERIDVTGHAEGFSPDGDKLVTTDMTNDQDDVVTVSVSIWEVASGRRIGEEIRLPKEHGFTCFAFGREDGVLMVVSIDRAERTLRWWDVTSGNQLRPPVELGTGDISAFTQSQDGKRLVLLDGTEYLDVRDLETGEQVDSLSDVTAVALAQDGTLATAHSDPDTNDATVRLWRIP